jgi:hypothetical protein
MLCRVFCDSSGDHTNVSISIKGARLANEDAICSDGRLFGVFDGHGGSVAALLAKSELPKHFYLALDSQEGSAAPKPVAGEMVVEKETVEGGEGLGGEGEGGGSGQHNPFKNYMER